MEPVGVRGCEELDRRTADPASKRAESLGPDTDSLKAIMALAVTGPL